MGDLQELSSIKETILQAREHVQQLEDRLKLLGLAKTQVESSAHEAKSTVEKHFQELKEAICSAIDTRQRELLDRVKEIEGESLEPLRECEDVVKNSIIEDLTVIEEGEKLVEASEVIASAELKSFCDRNNSRSLNSLPEVPPLSEVPCILLAGLDPACITELPEEIGSDGYVLAHAPVQVAELRERPGGVLASWYEIEDDDIPEKQSPAEYRLQYCCGRVDRVTMNTTKFREAYQGQDTCCTVKHLKFNVDYSFRVCCKMVRGWSPWSIPQVARTTLLQHEWEVAEDSGYSLSNGNTTLTRTSPNAAISVLHSSKSSLLCGDLVTFKVNGTGKTHRGDGLGLVLVQEEDSILQRIGAVCVGSTGVVHVNGKEMTNQLPALAKGTTVTFDTSKVPSDPKKLRVSITVADRQVACEWVPGGDLSEHLYFAACFVHKGWEITVE
ncbi:CRLF3 [Branchiostoma lanceolatum]|uniref:CRLF3 protein n=1 Tax=Branchiostoma lanceolatum TaxID=7740 RepID=A0A8K0AG49_BRALA|nr:CRLF3 [Branchiostoma lanceolatum]